MKLSDFILLNDEEKKALLLNQGILVSKRRESNLMVFLFTWQSMYVEMLCDLGSRQVQEFRVLTGEKLLAPYLEAISLDGLQF